MKLRIRCLFLAVALVAASVPSFAQLVWKTDYDVALETTGTVCKISSQDMGTVAYRDSYNTALKMYFKLNTFTSVESGKSVSEISIALGKGTGARSFGINTSEIDSIIRAVEMMSGNKDYFYITKTSNIKFGGDENSEIVVIYVPSDVSSPSNLQFGVHGYNVLSKELIGKLIEIRSYLSE